MEKKKLDRISELTAISRQRELTDEEKSEREALRMEYRRSVTANFTDTLEHTVIKEPDGSMVKVKDMKRSGEDK
ncbi:MULTISPECIES: DUF896 domain-containing protein [Ruminococcus]|uniref:Uncharacterized protein YnzC, UPF0291/DUF896 family n=2 Tax=Ruminococcus albus TaxID=1264 RepID=A0A1I1FYY3_RUMAL|nr:MULTISPECIES: DUF896 domain-containing protein [Ruminococcus]ADU23230.1 protein of unknown function DUF896 [Ruminococcus albus 7 = DSM 20455]MCR5021019.1 DUF896 domain-containing protein [Ruminococcus sp.]SFC04246.1 Uncharacterized protein YnzC, UPF0291/DUF896 family [Ruminococcus albus]